MGLIDAFIKFPRPTEEVDVLGTKVIMMNDEVKFTEPVKVFNTNLSIVTIANSSLEDVLIDDYKFEEEQHIFLTYLMHRTLFYKFKPCTLKELIFELCKIYSDIFKNHSNEADVCCKGWEMLYVREIRLHDNNVISLRVEYNELVKM